MAFTGVQMDMLSLIGECTESRKDMLLRVNLQRGTGFSGGKDRIRDAVRQFQGRFKELCEFIKREYGTGGFSGKDRSFVEHDSRGIRILDNTQIYDSPETGEYNKRVEWLYTWPEVTKKIIELIVMDEY